MAGQGADARPVAVVTGANRGIGREVARQLAGRGFLVVAGSRDLEGGERAARQIDPAGGRVIARQLDERARIQGSATAPQDAPSGPQVRWTWGPIAAIAVPLLLLLAVTLA